MQADLSKCEQAKVFLPSRVQHFLYLLIDNLLVFRLDYEEIVPLRCGDKFQPKPGCSVKSRARKQTLMLFHVKRIVSPCFMLMIDCQYKCNLALVFCRSFFVAFGRAYLRDELRMYHWNSCFF